MDGMGVGCMGGVGMSSQHWMVLGDTEMPLPQQGLCLRSS